MPIKCTLHRSETAHFECYECGSAFCENCISLRETEGFSGLQTDYFCPCCNVPAETLSLGNIIEPFSNRLTSFFLYPFQLTPLLLTLILACLGALFPSSILATLFVWVVMMKYAYETLTTTAQGGLRAPDVTWALINQDVELVFKQFIIFAIVGACSTFIFAHTGYLGFYVFNAAVILALPAIIMLLVATESIVQAINPLALYGIITRIGLTYFLMYLFLFFLLAGPSALFTYLPADILPQRGYIFLTLFLKQFYALISYHLMGYVLLQYHKEIGYKVDYSFFMQQRGKGRQIRQKSPEDELKNSLAVLIKMGNYEEATRRLRPYILEGNPELELSEKFLQLLRMAGEKEKAAIYSVRHLDLLVEKKKKKKALSAFADLKKGEPGPPAPDTVFVIAAWYQGQNDIKLAIDTYVYFLKHFKKHARQPEVYFALAKLLHEHANNSPKAVQILKTVIKSYPKHELAPEVKEYLALVT